MIGHQGCFPGYNVLGLMCHSTLAKTKQGTKANETPLKQQL